jgi:hypothetical protein
MGFKHEQYIVFWNINQMGQQYDLYNSCNNTNMYCGILNQTKMADVKPY